MGERRNKYKLRYIVSLVLRDMQADKPAAAAYELHVGGAPIRRGLSGCIRPRSIASSLFGTVEFMRVSYICTLYKHHRIPYSLPTCHLRGPAGVGTAPSGFDIALRLTSQY